MARSLGSLTIDLLLKTGQFETDSGRASKLAERRAKEMQRSYEAAGKAMGLAVIAGVTTVSYAVKQTINSMDDLSKSAQRVGLPTEELSKLAYAADLADVSLQDLQGSLGKMIKAQDAARVATSQQAKAFKAMGVDAIDPLTGKLRDTKTVFLEFADAFKKHGGEQDAIAAGMNIFGRSFQNIIPLIKDGAAGIREAGDELERFGGVISTQTGVQAEAFNDNLTRLKQIAGGVAVTFAAELLPAMVETERAVLGFIQASGGVPAIVDKIAKAFHIALEAAKALGIYLGTRYIVSVVAATAISASLTATMGTMTVAAIAARVALTALTAASRLLFGPVGLIAAGAVVLYELATAETDAEKAAKLHKRAMDEINGVAQISITNALNLATAKRAEAAASLEAAKAALQERKAKFQQSRSDAQMLASAGSTDRGDLAGINAGRDAQAVIDQRAVIDELSSEVADLDKALGTLKAKAGVEAAVAFLDLPKAIGATTDAIKKKSKATKEARDLMAEWIREDRDALRQEVEAAAGLQEQWDSMVAQLNGPAAAALYEHTQRLKEIAELGHKVGASSDEITAAINAENAAYAAASPMAEAARRAAQEYQDSWLNAVDSVSRAFGDWLTGGISSFKEFGRTLLDIGRRWASDLIAQWSRNGGLSQAIRQMFSGGFANAGTTGGGGGGFWSTLLGGGSGGGGGGGMLSSIGGAIGRFFGFGGSQGAAGTGWANAYGGGSTALAAGAGVLMPQAGGGALASGGGGGFGSLLQVGSMFSKEGTLAKFLTSPAAPWLGALGGAVWGFQQGGDTTGKILGGVAGGVAGYGLATGIGAGVAAYGAGAGLAGAGAAGLAAIPVVGWIALAAIAVNAISGGKLFGTKYKMDSASNDFNYGDSGIAGSQSITKVKQRSLFGGRKWTTETSGLPAEAVAALNEAFASIDGAVVEAASRLGVQAPELLAATFRQEFDKNGNLTREFGTIAGRVYQEAQDAFNKRYLAENLLMVAGQVGHAGEIDTLANQFRSSPDALTDFATLMLAMQDDIKKSTQLWDDTDGAITRVVGVIQDLQQAGEQLAQTYARVIGAANAYGSFIAGIQTQITMAGLNDYQRAQLAVEQQYRSQVKQANDLAKALGLSGARAEDLAKIEQLRALSMAEVQKQFEAQKNTFLEDLGLSDLGPGTDRDKLSSSMDLLQQAAAAGDMQRAQQLAQQALGFGRNLFASGSDYNALYNQVTGLVGGIDAGQAGFTDDALQSIADSLETLPTDIARAMFDLLAGQATLPPPPVPTAPPPGTGTPPPTGGTGGGGGGTQDTKQCVVGTSYMDDGTLAMHSHAGDVHVTHRPGEGFATHPLEAVGGAVLQPCVRLHLRGGGSWSGSVSTPFNHVDASADLQDGEWSRAPDMAGKEVFVQRGSKLVVDTVERVEDIGAQLVVPQSFGGRSFAAGDQPGVLVFSHNMMKFDLLEAIAYNTSETLRLQKSNDLKAANA